jgi:predicted DNA-binding transcriptional regulator AlpA
MQAPQRRLITTSEAARLLCLSPRSLEGYRVRGGGPPFYRVGKRSVRYEEGEVIEWAMRERLASTSAIGGPVRVAATRGSEAAARSTGTDDRVAVSTEVVRDIPSGRRRRT